MQKIVLATGNKGKVAELADMLSSLNIEVIPQSAFAVEDIPETGTTFVENAIIKARHAAKITGLPVIADDSGLAVDALGGAPGIYSARFAEMTDGLSGNDSKDSQNIQTLLKKLQAVPAEERQAQFICVLVLMRHADDPTPIICQGSWRGSIIQQPSGDGGFGYDPVFWVEEHQCTAAQLSKDLKNTLSHRGKALRQLMLQLSQPALADDGI